MPENRLYGGCHLHLRLVNDHPQSIEFLSGELAAVSATGTQLSVSPFVFKSLQPRQDALGETILQPFCNQIEAIRLVSVDLCRIGEVQRTRCIEFLSPGHNGILPWPKPAVAKGRRK